MVFNNLCKCLLFSILFVSDCGHDNCFRDYTGKINFTTDQRDVTIVIRQHDRFYSKWYELDSIRTKSSQNMFNIPWAEKYAQETCNNNCPDGNNTISDSIRVTILNTADKKVLKDTVFSCEEYMFNGDNIELPTITLP